MTEPRDFDCGVKGCIATIYATPDRAFTAGWGIPWTGGGITVCPLHLGRNKRQNKADRQGYDLPLWEEEQ